MKEVVRRALETEGFRVVDYSAIKSSVDFIARRDGEVLVVRALGNLDTLKPEHARDMVKLAEMLGGIPILVAEYSRWGRLEDDVLYYRHGVPAMNLNTFVEYLRGTLPSGQYVRGREIVPIDTEALRKGREEAGLSLQRLAEKVGTTKETIYRYEHGQYGTRETVERIEKVLGRRIRRGVRPSPSPISESLHPPFHVLESLGGKVREFRRLPWEAMGKKNLVLTFLREKDHRVLRRRISIIERARGTAFSYYLVIGRKRRGFPYIEEEELVSARDFKEIEKIARERNEER